MGSICERRFFHKASFASDGFAVDGGGSVSAAAFRCPTASAKDLCATAAAQAHTIAEQGERILQLEATMARLERAVTSAILMGGGQ